VDHSKTCKTGQICPDFEVRKLGGPVPAEIRRQFEHRTSLVFGCLL
jgi:hypothetical protein